jgi:REP element-mobilizing transposase RayT
MARPLRAEHEAAVYHIMSKGNRAEYIFDSDEDKEYYLDVIRKAVDRYRLEVYAYCVMGNHYHLLMGVPLGVLSKAMHFIQSVYGSHMRRERELIGHVFAGRYKSLCVEKESYLLELSRYIHLNPVRAGIAHRPEEYQWSSYVGYISKDNSSNWLKTDWLLQQYGVSYGVARRKYMEFVNAGITEGADFPVNGIVGQAILGRKEFIGQIVEAMEDGRSLQDIVSKRSYSGAIDVGKLYEGVKRYYRIGGLKSGRQGGVAADMYVYLAKKYSIATNEEIGKKVEGITYSAVAQRYGRILTRLSGDDKERIAWEKNARQIMSSVKG